TATLKRWAWVCFALMALQLFLGSWTSANYAAAACPDLPACGSDWSPSDLAGVFNLSRVIETDASSKVVQSGESRAIHSLHRSFSIVLTLALIWLIFSLDRWGGIYRTQGRILALLLGLQLCIGIANVMTGMPLLGVASHNGIAALLALSITNILHHLTPTR
ncbi:MAG: COX15/CtaA family protein, partial [Gammaproteobacteria bacterium]|nr:COX15/CtaA family protein [Gammaproteobacteria bacterium]